MGTWNTFSIDIAVPADRIAPLAAALREATRDWYDFRPASDEELVAVCLFHAEGGEDTYDLDRRTDGHLLRIHGGGHGKMGDAEAMERLYAEHGATGTVEGRTDDDDTSYLVVLAGGGAAYHAGRTIYPTHDPLTAVLDCLPLLDPGQAHTLRSALDHHPPPGIPPPAAGPLRP